MASHHDILNQVLSINGNNRVVGSTQPQLTIQEPNYLDNRFDNIGSLMNLTPPLLATTRYSDACRGKCERHCYLSTGLGYVWFKHRCTDTPQEDALIYTIAEVDNLNNVPAENNVNANLHSDDAPTTQQEGALISTTAEVENLSSVPAENNVNVNHHNDNDARDKDISILNLISGSSAPLQDLAPNQLDDYFSMIGQPSCAPFAC